ncbi:uncharacterized protein L969DRAFT_84752 [Mixia osmundae IAM 14324]|uniref:Partial AB-hydrolase lipase domain-containing protein n=1 Tax=Mixia osmundae (strain CBS 9802 / IAM 14324 / JCM 22182 / KY 12970) TaxID=764103 RepID=G7DTF2_MIXOS|nr:uncharacterized protein L969DRAFT_84752 [Mixia osmundae IAM 14324]KEI42862.1 hypothetical protein L969DRAFT_84752 [Mixia osmundae IAM 14324]GAA93799.1 hypothetical protein E5Q_00445 [Mixia osmundae IAM 14324]
MADGGYIDYAKHASQASQDSSRLEYLADSNHLDQEAASTRSRSSAASSDRRPREKRGTAGASKLSRSSVASDGGSDVSSALSPYPEDKKVRPPPTVSDRSSVMSGTGTGTGTQSEYTGTGTSFTGTRTGTSFTGASRRTFGGPEEAERRERGLQYVDNGVNFLNDHDPPTYDGYNGFWRIILEMKQALSFLITAQSFAVMAFIAYPAYITSLLSPYHVRPPYGKRDKSWENRIPGERFSARAEYYAEFWGYNYEYHDVETEDGFILKVVRLTSKKHRRTGHPVLLQHGILSNGATFVVNEERSLAFWLMERGYDVWLGNIRTNYKMPHKNIPRWHPKYWAWAVKEIGIYDCTATVEYIYQRTRSKVAYVGHSQGTGSMFLALSKGMRPELGRKMSCFCALGPSVYVGPVLQTFPFSLMRKFTNRQVWSLIFGVREFIPIIGLLQEYLPSWLFGHLAFPVFYFLFGFHDHNWVPRQIPKFFRTVGVPNPSELLYFYMANQSYTGCIFDQQSPEPWFPPTIPPVAIWWGDIDTLVSGKPLLDRIKASEPDVNLVYECMLPNYEHLDMLWSVNAPQDCYAGIREVIEMTRYS